MRRFVLEKLFYSINIQKKSKIVPFLFSTTMILFSYQNCARDFDSAAYSSSSEQNLLGDQDAILNAINSDLSEILSNKVAVAATISDASNTAFNCLTSVAVPCLNGTKRSIALNIVYATNSVAYAYNMLNVNSGFNANGKPCSTFNFLNQINGLTDENCSLKINVYWEPICADNTYSCPNNKLLHNFRVSNLKSNSSNNIVSVGEKNIAADSTHFTFDTFSDQNGSGVKLYNYNMSTDTKSVALRYQSCLGSLILSGDTCSCPTGKIMNSDSADKCMNATQDCRNSYPNTATCIMRYNTTTNTYVLNNSNISDFNCIAGYTVSSGQCLPINKSTYVDIGITSSDVCTKEIVVPYYGTEPSTCPAVNSSCSTLGEVLCCTTEAYILDGYYSLPISKFKCQ